jgi:hypothetical protein
MFQEALYHADHAYLDEAQVETVVEGLGVAAALRMP